MPKGPSARAPVDELFLALSDVIVDEGERQLIDALVAEALGPQKGCGRDVGGAGVA